MFSFGVMASGGGSNFKALLEKVQDGSLRAKCSFLIVNNGDCGAVQIAKEFGVPTFHISGKTHPKQLEYEEALLGVLSNHPVDLLLLAGYMKKIPDSLIQALPERILNIHPALLPKYGGKGFWGMNVHRAVIENHEKQSGPTVHLVTSEIDKGRILAQTPVPVLEGDSPEELAARILQQEHRLYWKTVLDYAKTLKLIL
ncbi:MAG: phosphoribosylglycinamide formyltransferase [Fibrobacteraceae bacterium]|nr:phosphoribosylglycinamide formyltransferase [Fibrobacteraceae bacterium]